MVRGPDGGRNCHGSGPGTTISVHPKKKLIGTFSLSGLLVAIILRGARLYMLDQEPSIVMCSIVGFC
jgi:hypothetical protein